ncbi:hypothetical protein GPJ81_17750 [Pseudomonas alkylphenolica]|uniref:Uncharacterized protein n=1 Tax=Pseudomonas alkylphenolica TaxID=237609 RepID=A0A6I6GZG0_9PSED|nr:DUF6236 family protein [Pseudomonas alkylphenolica]QGW78449.1 hypothetical protein GPJ81_17750 [Pseudomonas alkylphenolica]
MGEARRRRESDPNYGKPPPKPDFRGLIVSVPGTIEGHRYRARSTTLDEQELRFSLLFWDQLVWPTGAIHMSGGETERQLIKCGILERPKYNHFGDVTNVIINGQISAFEEYERKTPGAWAIAQGENSLIVNGGLGEVGKGALIELTRAVPIPHVDVPLNEVLELKERWRNELLCFRHHVEALADDIANSSDRSEQLEFHLKEINSACSDLMALGKEWRFPMHVSTFNASLNLKPTLIAQVTGAWEFGEKFCTEFAAASAAATGLYRGIKIDTDFRIRSPKRPATPYRYAYRIHTELI